MPVVVPFFESRGLSMQQIFLLQALFAVVVLVMEIPSGYAADILGRRVTLLVGSVFIALGHSMLLFADGFGGLAVFEMCLGIGVQPRFGHRPRDSVRLGSRARSRRGSASGTGRTAVHDAYGVGSVGRRVVQCAVDLVAGRGGIRAGLVGWIPLLIALSLVEPPGERMDATNHLANMREIFEHLMRFGFRCCD